MRETSKQPPPRVPSADFTSPRSHEISLEELMMIDLKAWIAAKEAIRRASDSVQTGHSREDGNPAGTA